MDPSDLKVVWILGAGFSRSLGGPLLANLFSLESQKDVGIWFPTYRNLVEDPARIAFELYHYGIRYRDGRPDSVGDRVRGEKLWDHAEEFLEYLDSARTHKSKGERLAAIMKERFGERYAKTGDQKFQLLSYGAKQLLAAECCGFLIDQTDLDAERWQPYVRWAGLVGAKDTIITFNYDLVLEKLLEGGKGPKWAIHLPRNPAPGAEKEGPEPGVAPALKLHGSVNWLRANGQIHVDKDHFALFCRDDQICIAAPGPSKLQYSTTLQDLWTRAEAALSEADVVVLLGYRFPETDSESKRRLLGAIENHKGSELVVRTVLGPDEPSARRVIHMVEYKLRPRVNARRFKLARIAEPLRVEDFLSVFTRKALAEGSA